MTVDADRLKVRREAARLVRKIARVLDAGPERNALLLCADQIENSVAVLSKTGNLQKVNLGASNTRLH
jgi:hypothetical protein